MLWIVSIPITGGDRDAHDAAPPGHPDATPTHPRARRRREGDQPGGTADERLLLTVGEAARRLGIGRSFVYELIAAGQIETIHIGRLCKVSVEALAAFVEQQRA